MLQTEQLYPRAGSQEYPSPAAGAEADGSTFVHFSPTLPDGVAPGNWIQTDPEKGWFVILRLYSPLRSFSTGPGASAKSSRRARQTQPSA